MIESRQSFSRALFVHLHMMILILQETGYRDSIADDDLFFYDKRS